MVKVPQASGMLPAKRERDSHPLTRPESLDDVEFQTSSTIHFRRTPIASRWLMPAYISGQVVEELPNKIDTIHISVESLVLRARV